VKLSAASIDGGQKSNGSGDTSAPGTQNRRSEDDDTQVSFFIFFLQPTRGRSGKALQVLHNGFFGGTFEF